MADRDHFLYTQTGCLHCTSFPASSASSEAWNENFGISRVQLMMRCTILCWPRGVSSSSGRSKGYLQHSMAYSMTPLLHTSASFPSYRDLFRSTSGAARTSNQLSSVVTFRYDVHTAWHTHVRLEQTPCSYTWSQCSSGPALCLELFFNAQACRPHISSPVNGVPGSS